MEVGDEQGRVRHLRMNGLILGAHHQKLGGYISYMGVGAQPYAESPLLFALHIRCLNFMGGNRRMADEHSQDQTCDLSCAKKKQSMGRHPKSLAIAK
jgi:hypothetical protein